jgi:hypothetical protein
MQMAEISSQAADDGAAAGVGQQLLENRKAAAMSFAPTASCKEKIEYSLRKPATS